MTTSVEALTRKHIQEFIADPLTPTRSPANSFTPPAVNVINHYGDEVLKVYHTSAVA